MSVLSEVVARLRALIFRHREDRELDEELQFHAEMEAEHQRGAGFGDGEAYRRSAIALGGVERVKEEVRDARGTRLLQDSVGDFAYALRALRRSPGFATVVILTLALGIGGTTAVFSAVDAVLLQPLPYQQPGQLVRIYQEAPDRPGERQFVTPVHFLAFRDQLASFETVAAILTYDESGADIGVGNDVRRIRLLPVSAGYFDVVRVRPELGRGFQAQDENGAALVVLSHELWQRQLRGDPSAVGRRLMMDGTARTVAGIMPAEFEDPVAGTIDAWVPLDLTEGKDPENANNHYLTVIARLRSTISVTRGQTELSAVAAELARQNPEAKNSHARFYPLKDDIVGSSSRALGMMMGAVGLVLVLVCVNIANLMLVRASERTRELAVRSALGAGRSRLVRQLLIESLTLALAGAVAGLLVARMAMSAIVFLGAGTIPRLASLSLDPRLLAFSLITATVCAVLFGLAPAVRAARTQPGDALRDQTRTATAGGRAMRLREWLVISQVAVAFVLLVGAGLLLASFRRIRQIDLGVKPDGVLTFELNLPGARYDSTARGQFYDEFAAELAALPGVRAAGGISRLPATGSYHQWGVQAMTGPLAHDEARGDVAAENRVVSGDYFRAVGIPVLVGRAFDARDDLLAPDRVVVSRSLADLLYPNTDPIGQRLLTGNRESEIIGVVGDVAIDNEGRPDRYVYHPHRQFAGDRNWALTQVVAMTPSATLQPAIRRVLGALDPQLVMFRPAMLDEVIGRGAAQRVFTLRILLAFAAVALGLSALGLFGVLSYGVTLRHREFGIRLALGADRRAIGAMVLRRGLTVTAIGIGIGLAGALGLSKLMMSMLFQVSPLDPRVLIGAVVFMALVAGMAAYLPAHRATSLDPRTALQ